ncbi:unnamed protein product [Malus baccata var. baccata]
MEHSRTIRNLVLLKFLRGFILLVLCMMSTRPESAAFPSPTLLGNESDHLALLDLKKRITEDPLSVMSSWNHSIHFCSWVGITCHRATQRVLILDLEDKQLVGSIPPSIGNLTRLIEISLGINKFHGEIPQELGRLRTLESLNLSFNSLGGKIPTNMSHCTQLRVFDLVSNKIIGSIPHQLSSWLSLTVLHITSNNLSGTIPGWIGNFSSLRSLNLGSNNFQGSIPNELGHITTLKIFAVWENNLSGNIPVSLSNASRLQVIDFAFNEFTGTIPGESLGSLRSLIILNFAVNRLGNGKLGDMSFLNFLTNCTSLQELGLSYNRFGGEIPRSIANLSTQLRILYLGDNLLHGSLPNGIGNLINLTDLDMADNYLEEYGMGGQVSILGDVYSYGILLLEMFTGKTPTDDMFIKGLSIYKFAAMALPDHVMDVVDPSLLLDLEADGSVNDDRYEKTALSRRNNHGVVKAKKVEECLFAVMQIGLSCCVVSPRERMLLNMVVGKMSAIRDSYLKVQEG